MVLSGQLMITASCCPELLRRSTGLEPFQGAVGDNAADHLLTSFAVVGWNSLAAAVIVLIH